MYKQENLMENYDKVRSFIKGNIIPFMGAFSNFESNILLSYSYGLFAKKYHRFINIIGEFEYLVNEGSKDIFYLIENQAKYIEYCKLINETFIQRKETRYSIVNAELFNFLYSIPSNLYNIVKSVFYISDFKNLKIDIDEGINVFVTKSLLEMHLKLILGNIRKRQNEQFGKEEENASKILSKCELEIEAKIQEEHVFLTITYSNTDKFNKPENSKGNLYQLEKAINNYGGKLDHELLPDGNYFIEINFINYGEEIYV